jgi:spore maturation protein CgeB
VIEFDDSKELERAGVPPWNSVYQRFLRVPWEPARRRLVSRLLQLARSSEPDLIIIMKGLFLGADDVSALKRTGAWVTNLNHDDFFSASPSNWSVLQRSAIPAYDHIFVTKHVNVQEVQARGGRASFLAFAYHPTIHRPVDITAAERAALAADVLFVGTWAPERGPFFERLARTLSARVAIFGTHWERLPEDSPARRFVRWQPLMGDDMAKAIGASKVCLGLLRKGNRDDHTQRSFEIPACGGLLLAERTHRHQAIFREGVEAEFFDVDNGDELVSKLRALLDDDDRREAIRVAGRLSVQRNHHTYTDRLQQILDTHAGTA